MPEGSVDFFVVFFLVEDAGFLSGVVLETVLLPSRLPTFFLNDESWLESLTHGAGFESREFLLILKEIQAINNRLSWNCNQRRHQCKNIYSHNLLLEEISPLKEEKPSPSFSFKYNDVYTISLDCRKIRCEQWDDFAHELCHLFRHEGDEKIMPKFLVRLSGRTSKGLSNETEKKKAPITH